MGALFHSSYKAVTDLELLCKEKITHVVNTTNKLESLNSNYQVSAMGCVIKSSVWICHNYPLQSSKEKAKSEHGIVFLDLMWQDATTFIIPEADLVKCVLFIHKARSSGGSVLVHCAQVRTGHKLLVWSSQQHISSHLAYILILDALRIHVTF